MASMILCVDNTQVVKLYLAQSGASRRMKGIQIIPNRRSPLRRKTVAALKKINMFGRTDMQAKHDDILVVSNLLAAALFEQLGDIQVYIERGEHLRFRKTVQSGLPQVLTTEDLL